MVRKALGVADHPVVVKINSQREDCLPQTLRAELVNGKTYIKVTNTGQREVHIYKDQNIGVVDLRSASYFNTLKMAYTNAYMRHSFFSLK